MGGDAGRDGGGALGGKGGGALDGGGGGDKGQEEAVVMLEAALPEQQEGIEVVGMN